MGAQPRYVQAAEAGDRELCGDLVTQVARIEQREQGEAALAEQLGARAVPQLDVDLGSGRSAAVRGRTGGGTSGGCSGDALEMHWRWKSYLVHGKVAGHKLDARAKVTVRAEGDAHGKARWCKSDVLPNKGEGEGSEAVE